DCVDRVRSDRQGLGLAEHLRLPSQCGTDHSLALSSGRGEVGFRVAPCADLHEVDAEDIVERLIQHLPFVFDEKPTEWRRKPLAQAIDAFSHRGLVHTKSTLYRGKPMAILGP